MFGKFLVVGRLARMRRDLELESERQGKTRKTQKTDGRSFGYFMQGYQLEILRSFNYTSMKSFRQIQYKDAPKAILSNFFLFVRFWRWKD